MARIFAHQEIQQALAAKGKGNLDGYLVRSLFRILYGE
jgi:hypothetical protein